MRSESLRARTYFSRGEVATTLHEVSYLGEMDVLLTHDWPSDLVVGRGNDSTRDLIEAIRPTLHLCGHMHAWHEGTIGSSIVNALNAVPPATKKQGREHFGWWRLYERAELGEIRCLEVGR